MRLPSDSEIQLLAATGDPFRYAIVGFSAIEGAVEELISESIPTSHRLELERLSFAFKLDLAVALGTLRPDSKGLFLKLSRVRNYYAHQFNSAQDYCPPVELLSSMSAVQRKMAGEHLTKETGFAPALRAAFVVAFYDVKRQIERIKEHKLQAQDARDHAEALLQLLEPDVEKFLEKPEVMAAKKTLEDKVAKIKDELRAKRQKDQDAK
ncbi:MAG: hypothetical protein ACHQQS_03230 [Thermoanaerobaculales bacterium]